MTPSAKGEVILGSRVKASNPAALIFILIFFFKFLHPKNN